MKSTGKTIQTDLGFASCRQGVFSLSFDYRYSYKYISK